MTSNERPTPPASFAVGDQLDWNSELVPVYLTVELPYWLMMEPATITIPHSAAEYELLVTDQDSEVFVNSFQDSRINCGYQGPRPQDFEERADIRELTGVKLFRRRQRTVVYFKARGLEDVLRSAGQHDGKGNAARSYLETLCEAHLPILNALIRRYRLLTYDYFVYEVRPWDVPIWHVRGGPSGHISVPLFAYSALGGRPHIYPYLLRSDATEEQRKQFHVLSLATAESLQNFNAAIGVPGEDDLLDSRNLMERGDYNGAVRRITTAIEAVVEWVLEAELLKKYDQAEVERRLHGSQNDFPGRLRQWQKLIGVPLPAQLEAELERTRQLRHEIVHRGRRLGPEEAGVAQRSVDTGRWIFNHIERDDQRRDLREKSNVVRAIARPTLAFRFPIEHTAQGIEVKSLRSGFSIANPEH